MRLPNNDKIEDVDNGDIKSFALAVRSYSETGAEILDRIQSKYRAPAHRDPATGLPDEYLDRDGQIGFAAGRDEPLDYFVDAWGTPIAYFAATCPCAVFSVWDNDTQNVQSPGDRARTCQALLSLSNQVPVFISYGPDGAEQFSDDFREGGYWPDLIYDFNEQQPKFKFDHVLNHDNVYSSEAVQDKILRVSFAEGVFEGSEN